MANNKESLSKWLSSLENENCLGNMIGYIYKTLHENIILYYKHI